MECNPPFFSTRPGDIRGKLYLCMLPLIMSLCLGCGGRTAPAPSSDTRPAEDTASTSVRAMQEIGWAASYGGEANKTEFDKREDELWQSLAALHRCQIDDRFTAAARYHAASLLMSPGAVDDGAMDQLRFTLQKLGAYDYGIESAVITLDEGSLAFLADLVARQGAEWTHCGLGIAEFNGQALAVWIGTRRSFSIKPFPVSTRTGTKPVLRVRTTDGRNGDVQLFVGLPDTRVIKPPPVGRKSDGGVSFEIPVETDGRYELELLLDTGHGPETVLLVPFFAGIAPDARVIVSPDVPTLKETDPEKVLLKLLNDARAEVGACALIRDRRLDAVARKHSEDMTQNGFFGHVSPFFGGLAKRLDAAKITLSRSGENIAASVSPVRIHRNLMGSPAHRINMLNPLFTHVGIGVAARDNLMYGTEIYGKR